MSQFQSLPPDFRDIINHLQSQEAQRREDALARYAQANDLAANLTQQIGSLGTYGAAEAQLAQVGDAAHSRIRDTAQQQFAAADQDLTTRGLGNTTIRESARRGVNLDAQRAANELDEGLAAQRAGLLERRAGAEFQAGVNEIDTMLSRVDEPVDYGFFANLLQQASATPTGRQQITIGPGSSTFGSQFRGTSSPSGGGGTRTGVTTYNNQGQVPSFQGAAGSTTNSGSGGVRTITRRSQPTYKPGSNSNERGPVGGGGGITSYGNAGSGLVSDPSIGGRVFGPGIQSGVTYQGQTGSGQPIFASGSGAITNDPTRASQSEYMRPGSGTISDTAGLPGGDFEIQQGGQAAPFGQATPGMAVAPSAPQQGADETRQITVQGVSRHTGGQSKTITVPASALGSGPGGFKDEQSYLRYVPPGYRVGN